LTAGTCDATAMGSSTDSLSVYRLPGISQYKNMGCFTGVPSDAEDSVGNADVLNM